MGRWLWKGEVCSGQIVEVEWTAQALKPTPDVLAWSSQAPAHIVARVPGLYRVGGAIFGGGPASIGMELLVDGAVALVVAATVAAAAGLGSRVAPRVALDTVLSMPAGATVALRLVVAEGEDERDGGSERWLRAAGTQAFLELGKM